MVDEIILYYDARSKKHQNSTYMFRPLEAIFRLHKIELEEREIIHIVCATAYQL